MVKDTILRTLEGDVRSRLGRGKAIVVLGARQTGKTTFLTLLCQEQGAYLHLDADDPVVRDQLTNPNTRQIAAIIGTYPIVFIDEAQRIPNIGLTIKIMTDQFPSVQVIVSGSSALDLQSEIAEPLTGRKWEYRMYPISWQELRDHLGFIGATQELPQRLIYGMYPDVVTHPSDQRELITGLSDSYLYKDLLNYSGIRKPEVLGKLLRALALQVGNEVSLNELSQLLQIDKNTVSTYLDLLEKTYVIFRLQPLSRNLRNEISTSRKIYFWDNGVRNALISNFNEMSMRMDQGALWENFMISERIKFLHNNHIVANVYFWRTHQQQEIDLVEERDGRFYAYEFKWGKTRKKQAPASFMQAYEAEFSVIAPDNFTEFLV